MGTNYGKDFFHNIQGLWGETMDEIRDEMNEILNSPDSECDECDGAEYMEAAIAESHGKNLTKVMDNAMGIVGKFIDSTVDAYDDEERYASETNFRKGQHLCIVTAMKSYHAIYIGCGKVVYYSKGYEIFPEIKIVPVSFFAKKGKVQSIDTASEFSENEIVKRAVSKLGDNDFKNSESFVKWCMGL